MKLCGDSDCERLGERLNSDQFYARSKSDDGLDLYCIKCRTRRVHESRRRSREHYKRKHPVVKKQKPAVKNTFAFSLVYDAIKSGSKTREQIQRVTKLSFDEIGEALLELVFEARGVRIQDREFVLNDVEEKIAA